MSNTDIIVKRRRLSKNIRKTIIDLGIRESDAAYLIKNLLFNNTKQQLVEIVEADDIPIAIQIFAHALLTEYKKGTMTNTASMMQWAFDKTPEKIVTPDELKTEDQLDEEIKLLLTNN